MDAASLRAGMQTVTRQPGCGAGRLTGDGSVINAQDVDAVAFSAPGEQPGKTCVADESGVHGVAVANVVVDLGQKMHEFELAAVRRAGAKVDRRGKVVIRPVVGDLRYHDQIEVPGRPFVRKIQRGKPDVGNIRAARARGFQRALVDIDGEQGVAPGGQHGCENADRTSDLEYRSETPAAQCVDGRSVLCVLVRARREVPWIGRLRIDARKVFSA